MPVAPSGGEEENALAQHLPLLEGVSGWLWSPGGTQV